MFFKKKPQISKEEILNIVNPIFNAISAEGISISENNIESTIIVGDKISMIISAPKEIAGKEQSDNITKIKNYLVNAISQKYPKFQINIIFTSTKIKEEKPKKSNSDLDYAIPKPQKAKNVANIKKIIAVASGKGGVGKSTIASNLALSLAKKGLNVGLVDADIHGPSIAKIMNIKTQPEIVDNMMIPILSNNIKCMSMGFLLSENAPAIWRGPMITKALHQLMLGANWAFDGKAVDVLIMDLPPGTGDIQLSMAQNYKIDGVVLVSTPQEVAILDVKKAYSMFSKLEIPILGIIENMAYFEDSLGNKNYIFGNQAVQNFCDEYNIKLLAQVPLISDIAKICDEGLNDNSPCLSYLDKIQI